MKLMNWILDGILYLIKGIFYTLWLLVVMVYKSVVFTTLVVKDSLVWGLGFMFKTLKRAIISLAVLSVAAVVVLYKWDYVVDKTATLYKRAVSVLSFKKKGGEVTDSTVGAGIRIPNFSKSNVVFATESSKTNTNTSKVNSGTGNVPQPTSTDEAGNGMTPNKVITVSLNTPYVLRIGECIEFIKLDTNQSMFAEITDPRAIINVDYIWAKNIGDKNPNWVHLSHPGKSHRMRIRSLTRDFVVIFTPR